MQHANYDKVEVLGRMKGMYRHALQTMFGLDDKVFSKKHQSCPNCGGKDRFRWTDNLKESGDGGTVCSGCGNDTGLGWIMKLGGMSFSEAIDACGNFLNLVPQEFVFKANKQAHRDSGYRFGSRIDHEDCERVLSRTVEMPQTVYTATESIYAQSYQVGIQTLPGGSEAQWITIPCLMVHEDGLDDEYCNLMLVGEEGETRFLAKEMTFGSVIPIAGESEAIYLVTDWVQAHHAALAMNAEVWCCMSSSNLEIVAHRYKGGRELRVVTTRPAQEDLIQADHAQLKVLFFNGDDPKRGVERKIYDPDLFIK